MSSSLKRLLDDIRGTWRSMPAGQALRWYAAVLRHAPAIVRSRKFYPADAAMRGELRFHVLDKDVTVDVDAINTTAGNGYAFLRELFVRQIYFRAFRQLRFDTCLDLGCNTGVVASCLRSLGGPEGRVYGVDPFTYPDSVFRASAAKTPGITLEQRVLCGESIRHDADQLRALCEPYGFDPALAATLEEVMDAHHLDHIDFLKMDIEGAEFRIFRDSTRWLERVDNLAMEIHSHAGDPTEIVDRLRAAGFQVKWLSDSGYATSSRDAGYIYASRNASLR
jgi:FkbM family methyltransferase